MIMGYMTTREAEEKQNIPKDAIKLTDKRIN